MESRSSRSSPLPVALALILIISGCATTPPKSGPAEYRDVALEVQSATSVARKQTEILAAWNEGPHGPGIRRFDDAAHRLEIVSMKARARIDAMEKRGEAYFSEWTDEIAASDDDAARRAAQERMTELRRHFDAVRQESQQVRKKLRGFVENLRELRTSLGRAPDSASLAKARPALTQAGLNGHGAEEALGRLIGLLNAADAALRAGPARPPQP